MKALVQRVSYGKVTITEENYQQSIGKGLVILLGVTHTDSEKDAIYIADKCTNLRIFEDTEGKMNLSLKDIDGEVLIISQFTLYGNTIKGNRPNFMLAAKPELAKNLYLGFIARMENNFGSDKIKRGLFGAMMTVIIHNDGPVTISIESNCSGKNE